MVTIRLFVHAIAWALSLSPLYGYSYNLQIWIKRRLTLFYVYKDFVVIPYFSFTISQANVNNDVFMLGQGVSEQRQFSLESRRYIGCKAKLSDWIFKLISENTSDVHSFCDIFAGTGVIAHRALKIYDSVIVNDFLFSNNVMYKAFFGAGEWDKGKVFKLITAFNKVNAKKLSTKIL